MRSRKRERIPQGAEGERGVGLAWGGGGGYVFCLFVFVVVFYLKQGSSSTIVGLILMNCEIMTSAEVQFLTTKPPGARNQIFKHCHC